MDDLNQWWVFARTLGSLILIIGLIYGLAWLAKKYFHPQKWGQGVSAGIKVLQSLPIGPRTKVLLIEVDGRRVLVGVTHGHIATLKDLSESSSDKNTVRFDTNLNEQMEGKYVRQA